MATTMTTTTKAATATASTTTTTEEPMDVESPQATDVQAGLENAPGQRGDIRVPLAERKPAEKLQHIYQSQTSTQPSNITEQWHSYFLSSQYTMYEKLFNLVIHII